MKTNSLFKLLLITLQTIFCLTCLIATIPNGYYNNLYGVPVFVATFSIIVISLVLINLVPNMNKSKIQRLLLHNITCSVLTFIPIIGWIAIIYNFVNSLFIMNITISTLVSKYSVNYSEDDEENEEEYLEKLINPPTENHINSEYRASKTSRGVNKYSR